jgi:transcriptional regulator with XRE-family HTH domain
MNRFAEWMQSNDKKQRGVAEKLGISKSTLHDILRKGQMPSLKLAYEIEKYTKGAITIYDWIDTTHEQKKQVANTAPKISPQEIRA